jgi:2-hydroxychromene-2-carboxylate isomerase
LATPIEFFFDFSSPYSYLACEQIEALAARHGRGVAYQPVLLGAAFRVSGQRPLTEIPVKGDYSRRDFARSARFAGLPFAMPEPFPISTVQAARAFEVLRAQSAERARDFVQRAFRAYFVQGRNLADVEVLHAVLVESGADATRVLEETALPQIKEQLKLAVESAIARGVFGAPFFFIDDEPFWGHDRLPQMERWLASGPF